MNRQLVQWFRLRLCSHCLKYHRGRVEMISAELWNMELLDISTVKSKILPIVSVEDIPVKASMLFDWTFWSLEFMNRQLVQWSRLRLCSHRLKYHRGRVEMISAELWNMELLDISTVKSKILPIVSVEDIPVEASMPNLVQLCQKSLL